MKRSVATIAAAAVCAAAVATPALAGADNPTATAAATKTVKLKDTFFSPKSIKATKSATLKFVWAGRLAHNLVGKKIPKSYERAAVRKKSLTRTYTKGSYTFECTIHPGMVLKLKVS